MRVYWLGALFAIGACARSGAPATTPGQARADGEAPADVAEAGDAGAPAADAYVRNPAFCPGDEEPMTAAVVPKNERYAPRARRFSDVESAADRPIEACGAIGQTSYLRFLECDDGKRVFGSLQDAHAARVGSSGRGGRCGAVVDLYEVACPEGTYSIYMDLYKCTEREGNPLAAGILPLSVSLADASLLVDASWDYRPVEGLPGAVRLRTGDVVGVVAARDGKGPLAVSDLTPLVSAELGGLESGKLKQAEAVEGMRVFRYEEGGEVWMALFRDDPGPAMALVRGPADQVDAAQWQAPLATVAANERAGATPGAVFSAGELELETLDAEPRDVVIAAGWAAYGDGRYTESRRRGRYDFVRMHNVAHRTNGRTARRMAWDAADSFPRSGLKVEAVFDGALESPATGHGLVLEFGETRLVSVVVPRGDWATTVVLVGDRDDLEEVGGAALAARCAVETDRINAGVELVEPAK